MRVKLDGEVDPRAGLAHETRPAEGKGPSSVGCCPTGELQGARPVVQDPTGGDPVGRW